MGVRPALPVEGVSVIQGNDLAGGRVWTPELVKDQNADPSLIALFDPCLFSGCVENCASRYFLQGDLLVKKWTPHGELEKSQLVQLLVSFKFQEQVLRVSHDQAGHQRCRKCMTVFLCVFSGLVRNVMMLIFALVTHAG